ncbi:glycosyltransferase family 4 protein [Acidipropionibacterium timonense]|uniref:glycosyltransferase family 4 protein n=1 Tax=Acidipropionibacterium timonense TaxID=2161818 RepID=UPI001436B225|nr:glycosyltransferase family 4 protein [Acidipropionibacterium timonense]
MTDDRRNVASAVVFMPTMAAGGGAERYALAVAVHLRDAGWSVHLASTGEVRSAWLESHFGMDVQGIELVRLPEARRMRRILPRAVADLVVERWWRHLMHRSRPDLFVNCLFRSEMPPVGRHGIYVCHFPHRLDVAYAGRARTLYMDVVSAIRGTRADRTAILRSYDIICANSEFTSEHILRRWGLPSIVVPPPCESMSEAGVPRSKEILAVGRIEPVVPGVPNKRLDVLVDTFSRMTDLHQAGWALRIVGACPPSNAGVLQSLRDRAAGLPAIIDTNLSFAELRRRYSEASIYWHAQGFGESADQDPQTQEHFGITTVEAMSAGCIPVVIDTAGPREVTLGVPGLRRWSTVEELMAETRRVAALDDDETSALRQAVVEHSRTYDVNAFQRRFTDVLDRAAEGS